MAKIETAFNNIFWNAQAGGFTASNTTNTTFTDTNITVDVVTTATATIMVWVSLYGDVAGNPSDTGHFIINIDGSDVTDSEHRIEEAGTGVDKSISLVGRSTGIGAGTITCKVRFRSKVGTSAITSIKNDLNTITVLALREF